MKVYNFLKDFLVYSILGFILVPLKFLFWIFSADGWFVISHLGEILQGNVKVPNAWKKLALVSVSQHMRAGFYDRMSIPKKVEFLEKNFSYLKELEIISKADSKNSELSFSEIGEKMFSEINGNTVVVPNNEKAREILHQKRVEWLKNINLK